MNKNNKNDLWRIMTLKPGVKNAKNSVLTSQTINTKIFNRKKMLI